MDVTYAGETWTLLPEHAAWWTAERTLLVADLHFGKDAAFRMAGIPVPGGATAKDLARLTHLIERHAAERLVILGDFFHARTGRQRDVTDAIANWRRQHRGVQMLLVRGNHDRAAGDVPAEWTFETVNEPFPMGPVDLCHNPARAAGRPVIAGHVHPTVSLRDYDGSAVNAPCFVVDQAHLLLPSFGTFTGGYRMDRHEGREMYVPAGKRVIRVTA
jgi:uncharacterized protein